MPAELPGWIVGLIWCAYGIWGFRICWLDATTRRLPNVYTWPAFLMTVIFAVVLPGWHAWQLLGGALWAGFVVVAPIIDRRMGVGGGDAKLALTLGTLAVSGGFWGLWIALAVAGAVGVGITVATTEQGEDRYVPHGPAMVAGTIAALVFLPTH